MLKAGISRLKENRQLSNLMIYGIGQGFNLITPLLVIPYIISVCGLEHYGKSAFGMALTFFLIVFIDYGSDIIGVKAIATNRGDKAALERIFATTYAAKLCVLFLILAMMAALFCIVPYFSKDKYLFLLGLPILVGQFLNPTWFLQGVENFKQITILNILSKAIYLAGIFCFVKTQGDYIFINLWWGIGMIIANGISVLQILKTHGFRMAKVGKNEIATQLRHNFSMFFSQIFVSMQLYSPLILIGFFGNPTMAGTYRVVDQVIVIFKTYLLLFFNFAFPRVCFLIDADPKKAMRFWKIYNGANFVFVLVAMAGIYALSEPIVAYFHPQETRPISQLLEFAILIPVTMAISIPLKQLILGYNHSKFYINTTMVLVLGNLLLMVLLLPFYGISGVLASVILIEAITSILFFIKIKNRFRQS